MMHKLRDWFASLPPMRRRTVLTTGLVALLFVGFSLATIADLVAPANFNELIVNPIPLLLGLISCIATYLAAKGRTRLASYLLIISVIAGFFVIAFFSDQPVYSSVAELIIVIVPLLIAVQSLSEREFTWIVVITLVSRSVVQIVGSYKSSPGLTGASVQTAAIAQWISFILTGSFIVYVAFNLNRYAFRVKMILVLGLLTIVPTAVLTSVSRNNLETNLNRQANQSLVLSSDQLSAAMDLYIQTTMDTTRVEAQIPGFEDYLGQPNATLSGGGYGFPRGTELEKTTTFALQALLKKDPLNIISVRLLDRLGVLQLSTNQAEVGQFKASADYWTIPYQTGYPYMSPTFIDDNGMWVVHFAAPIRSNLGITNGILDIVYSASVFQQVIARNSEKLGQDVGAMLLDDQGIIMAHSQDPSLMNKIINPPDDKTITNLIDEKRLQNLPRVNVAIEMTGLTPGLKNLATSAYFSGNFHPKISSSTVNSEPDQAAASRLSALNWTVVTFVPRTTLLAPVQQQTRAVVFISILISLISIAIALGLTQILISPILSLTRTSERVTQGDINATATIQTQDEIGTLATTFNAMTGRVRDLIGGLEQRVAERTKALERRAVQLQAAGDVGSTAARLRDLDELLRQATRLISQRFGFYHVGIFLLDELSEYAVLRATNSEGGQRMLDRQHKLKVGQIGIVGFVAGTGQPRVALNVGQDAEYFNNPDLPLTQSEMALPLIAGGKVLGVLDIQSTEAAAFGEDDVTTLKVLADQIAVAIENARLFTENQSALETARRAYGDLSIKGWQTLLKTSSADMGYISLAENHIAPATSDASPELHQAVETGKVVLANEERTLYLPIMIRGKSIGAIRMDKYKNSERWSPEDIEMSTTLAEQLGTALESARLFADTRQRAEREYIISDIASKIGASIQIDTILRTSVEELGRALNEADVSIQMARQTQRGNGNGNE